jgi:hypothetical protein
MTAVQVKSLVVEPIRKWLRGIYRYLFSRSAPYPLEEKLPVLDYRNDCPWKMVGLHLGGHHIIDEGTQLNRIGWAGHHR